MCYGEYKENNPRCSRCVDRNCCNIETDYRERKKKNEKGKNNKN